MQRKTPERKDEIFVKKFLQSCQRGVIITNVLLCSERRKNSEGKIICKTNLRKVQGYQKKGKHQNHL